MLKFRHKLLLTLNLVALIMIATAFICLVVRPKATLELTHFIKISDRLWRAPLNAINVHKTSLLAHRLPVNDMESIMCTTELYESNKKLGHISRLPNNLSSVKDVIYSINDHFILIAFTDETDPRNNNKFYEISTHLIPRLRVWIVLLTSIGVCLFCMIFTSLPAAIHSSIKSFRNSSRCQSLGDLFLLPVNSLSEAERSIIYVALFLFSTLLILPDMLPDVLYGVKFVRFEDAARFIGQAQNFNIRSLWQGYNGYHHLYMRIIALTSSLFSLEYRPDILVIGFWTAYFIMVFFIITVTVSLHSNLLIVLAILLAIIKQPHEGEVLAFNAFDNGFLLGLALTLYMLYLNQSSRLRPVIETIFLLISGLTGMASVFLMPALLVKNFIYSDFKLFARQYISVYFCAAIQVSDLSSRATQSFKSKEIWPQIRATLFFDGHNTLQIISAILFWVLLITALVLRLKKSRRTYDWMDPLLVVPILGFLAACCNLAGGYVSLLQSGDVMWMSRYTWISNALFFSGALILSRGRPYLQVIIFGSIYILCMASTSKTPYEKAFFPMKGYHFTSYARLSYYKNIWIPGRHGSKWGMETIEAYKAIDNPITPIELSLNRIVESGNFPIRWHEWPHLPLTRAVRERRAHERMNIWYFKEPIMTKSASHIGVEITLWRKPDERTGEVPVTLYWGGRNKNFNRIDSFTIKAPLGESVMHFAFPNKREKFYLLLDPNKELEETMLRRIRYYRLP